MQDGLGIDDIFWFKGMRYAYNPKVTQATMGALLHTRVHYTDLAEILPAVAGEGIPVYATTLEGESIYESTLPQSAMILFGNESKGISRELMQFVSHQLLIPFRYKGSRD
ncbi:MAG: TrmH family RNA methyltransferase [Bacteroidales bacterium]